MLVKNTKLSVTGEGVFLLIPGERIRPSEVGRPSIRNFRFELPLRPKA